MTDPMRNAWDMDWKREWGLLLLFLACVYLRQKQQIILCLLPLTYTATILLGPVALIRYLFPVMISVPVLTVLLFLRKES